MPGVWRLAAGKSSSREAEERAPLHGLCRVRACCYRHDCRGAAVGSRAERGSDGA